MEIFIPVLLISITIIIGFAISYSVFQNEERQKYPWRRLADKHNLTYTPGTFFGPKGRVSGLYRGCHLSLKTFKRSQGKSSQTYTALVLTNHKYLEPATLSPIEALEWFTDLSIAQAHYAQLEVVHNGRELAYQAPGLENSGPYLQQLFDVMSDLLLHYEAIVGLGGEAMAPLKKVATGKNLFRQVATTLIQEISRQTTQRFGQYRERHICPDCLVTYDSHTVRLSWWRSVTFYGCRQCRQSRRFLSGRLMAVLDDGMNEAWLEGQDKVQVNWLNRRALMDFDEVHIIRADDEDVERFAVQVGNDTDPKRQKRYATVPCTISADCRLSPNTLRILERTFGHVAVLESVGERPIVEKRVNRWNV